MHVFDVLPHDLDRAVFLLAVLTDRLLLHLSLVFGNVTLVLLQVSVEPLGDGAAPGAVDDVLVCVHVLHVDRQPLTDVVTTGMRTFLKVGLSVVNKFYVCLQFHKRFTTMRAHFLFALKIC